jgi:DNA-binding NarL/FixJ family response regulator
MNNIQVLLVHPHQETRNHLAGILSTENNIDIIAEAGSGQDILDIVKLSSPDVVVMGLTRQSLEEQMTLHIHTAFPDIKILALSMFVDENSFSDILAAGARGFLVINCADEELASAIRSVYRGRPYFCAISQEILIKECLPKL